MNQFIESLKRLYDNSLIDSNKILQLFNDNKITEKERKYILGN